MLRRLNRKPRIQAILVILVLYLLLEIASQIWPWSEDLVADASRLVIVLGVVILIVVPTRLANLIWKKISH